MDCQGKHINDLSLTPSSLFLNNPFCRLTHLASGECLLLSSLPGKALRTLVDIQRLAERFNMHSQTRAW